MSQAYVLNNNAKRQSGRKAQLSNIHAAKAVAETIKTCLGPKAMLKMLLDGMGGVVLTNDGHAILREVEVSHPAAKSMIELSRTQDEEVGDGTTTVIILAGECLMQAIPHLERNLHPITIISGFKRALVDGLKIIEKVSINIDLNDDQELQKYVKTSIGTKFTHSWADLMCNLAIKAVQTVAVKSAGITSIDIKRYARIEKIPGGEIEGSEVLDGIILNKDVTHPKMRRKIKNPRIILLDCPLEYKKGESQTNIEISDENDWNRILQIEEEQIKKCCSQIIALKPDLIFTEKGISDLAQHYFLQANVTAIRRLRKTDNNRAAKATGAKIVNRVEDLKESDVGTKCGLFEVKKIGDEYFTFLVNCVDPKACSIILRGPSKDILNEIERNLQDAMFVARNILLYPKLCPGGGATEIAVSIGLTRAADQIEGLIRWPYLSIADALEVIPRTLAQNCGVNPIQCLSLLKARHLEGQNTFGINGDSGVIVDMKEYGVWEPLAIKIQSLKTAVENACLLLRVDDIVSGVRKQGEKSSVMSGPSESGIIES